MTSREQLLATTFVDLADTLVADFDVIDFLHMLAGRSVELLDADAAGIMLADQRGGLRSPSSSEDWGSTPRRPCRCGCATRRSAH